MYEIVDYELTDDGQLRKILAGAPPRIGEGSTMTVAEKQLLDMMLRVKQLGGDPNSPIGGNAREPEYPTEPTEPGDGSPAAPEEPGEADHRTDVNRKPGGVPDE